MITASCSSCFFKSCGQAEDAFGGLHAPISCFLQYVDQLGDTFFQKFLIYTKISSVGSDILKVIKKITVPFQCCSDNFPHDYLQKLFLRLCIYYSLNLQIGIFDKKEGQEVSKSTVGVKCLSPDHCKVCFKQIHYLRSIFRSKTT